MTHSTLGRLLERLLQDMEGEEGFWHGQRDEVTVYVVSDLEHDWEKGAPAGELLTNERMRDLWAKALDAQEADGKPVTDAFGRRLSLNLLPYDLLMQVDPRNLASDATRLPEDVIEWSGWVSSEVR